MPTSLRAASTVPVCRPAGRTVLRAENMRVDTGRCLNRGNRLSQCRLCVYSCPAQAISWGNDVPELVRDACTGCGSCLSACPTGAFSSEGWNERRFVDGVRKIRVYGEQPVIACGREASGDLGRSVFHIACCPGAFSLGALFEAAFDGDVTFLVDLCASCPNASVHYEFLRRAERVNSLLASLDRSGRIKTATADVLSRREGAAGTGAYLDLRHSASGDLSDVYARRREMLISQFFEPHRKGKRSSGALSLRRKGLEMRTLPDLSPAWRGDMRRFWEANVARDAVSGPWPQVWVDRGRCVACGTCYQLCPAHAIDHLRIEGDYVIAFMPGRCLDCGRCERACPTGALTHAMGASSDPFAWGEVVRYQVHDCPSCHGASRAPHGGLCYWCRHEDQGKRMVEDMRRALR